MCCSKRCPITCSGCLMKTEMKAMTELPYYKDIKLQNDRTYRVYLYPDSSPCAVDIDRRNCRASRSRCWRTYNITPCYRRSWHASRVGSLLNFFVPGDLVVDPAAGSFVVMRVANEMGAASW